MPHCPAVFPTNDPLSWWLRASSQTFPSGTRSHACARRTSIRFGSAFRLHHIVRECSEGTRRGNRGFPLAPNVPTRGSPRWKSFPTETLLLVLAPLTEHPRGSPHVRAFSSKGAQAFMRRTRKHVVLRGCLSSILLIRCSLSDFELRLGLLSVLLFEGP